MFEEEKSEETKFCRRKVLKALFIGVLSLIPIPKLLSQQTEKRQLKKQVKINSGVEPCNEESIVANIQPQFKIGQTFKYKAIRTDKKLPEDVVGKQVAPGKIVLTSEPIPIEQTIKIEGYEEYKDEKCFLIKREAILENPVLQFASEIPEKTVEEKTTTYINEAGKILYSESKTILKEGQSTSVSTNKVHSLPFSADIYYFYGYWMLALSQDFSWECLQNTPKEQILRSIKVKGNERINGKNCYVVEKLFRAESTGSEIITFWIDLKNRVAIQVKKGNSIIKLIF
ncbi:MAG: hypothetical protein AB1410_10875 [Acidobacteriota bacterium]